MCTGDIENCEGWLSPGGHSSGGRALTAKVRGPRFNPGWLPVFHSSLKIHAQIHVTVLCTVQMYTVHVHVQCTLHVYVPIPDVHVHTCTCKCTDVHVYTCIGRCIELKKVKAPSW